MARNDFKPKPIVLCSQCQHRFPAPFAYPFLNRNDVHSNHTITLADIQRISQLRRHLQEELKRYAAQEMELQRMVNLLRRDQWRLKVYEERYDYCLSRVRWIPVEIWTEIFYMACEEDFKDIKEDDDHIYTVGNKRTVVPIQPTAVRLSEVCVRWGEIVRSTPKLWSFLSLDLSFEPFQAPKTQRMLQLHLRRSQSVPLHVRLRFPDALYPERVDVHPILDVVKQTSKRWCQLSVSVHSHSWLTTLLSLHQNLPILEHLTFDLDRPMYPSDSDSEYSLDVEPEYPPWTMEPFKDTPKLHHMTLVRDNFTLSTTASWSHITSLKFERRDLERTLGALRLCPNVNHLTIEHPDVSWHEYDEAPLSISSIKHLCIVVDGPRDIGNVLRALTLPSLSSLSFDIISDRYYDPPEDLFPTIPLTALIKRSSCSLHTLSFANAGFGRELHDILEVTPALETLVLRTSPTSVLTEEVLRRLTYPPTPSAPDASAPPNPLHLLRHLKHLDMTLQEADVEPVLVMLKSRLASNTCTDEGRGVSLATLTLQIRESEATTAHRDATEKWAPPGSAPVESDDPFAVRMRTALQQPGLRLFIPKEPGPWDEC